MTLDVLYHNVTIALLPSITPGFAGFGGQFFRFEMM